MNILGVDIDNTLTNASSPWNITSGDIIDLDIAKQLLYVDERLGIGVLSKCEMKIVLITARHEEYRDVTLNWLKNKPIKHEKLIMRDFRFSGGVFNLSEYLDYKYKSCLNNNITYMMDDDEKVVNMLNSCGITSILVDRNGRFDTAYFELLKRIK